MKTIDPMTVLWRARFSRRGSGLISAARRLPLAAVIVALHLPMLATAGSQQTFADKRLGARGNHPLRLTPNLSASEWTSSGQMSEVKVVNGRVEVNGWVAGTELDRRQFAQFRLVPDEGWTLDRFQLSWKCLGIQTNKDRPRIAFADVWAFVGTNEEPSATFGVFRTLRNQPASQNWSAPLTTAPGEPVTLRFYAWGAEPLDGSSHFVLDDLRLGGTVVTQGASAVPGWFGRLLGTGADFSGALAFVGVGVFAAVALLSVIIAVWILILMLRRFSGMASQQGEIIRAISTVGSQSSADRADLATRVTEVAEQTCSRLSIALSRIEVRIRELVQSVRSIFAELAEQRAAKNAAARPATGRIATPPPDGPGFRQARPEATATSNGEHVEMLLGKGQALLSLGKPEPALICFEEALRLQPQNTEAILKTGQALEILQRLDEAMRCYDRAVRLDDSLAIAWLHKGRICNRLERHEEALECYEHAGKAELHEPHEAAQAHRA